MKKILYYVVSFMLVFQSFVTISCSDNPSDMHEEKNPVTKLNWNNEDVSGQLGTLKIYNINENKLNLVSDKYKFSFSDNMWKNNIEVNKINSYFTDSSILQMPSEEKPYDIELMSAISLNMSSLDSLILDDYINEMNLKKDTRKIVPSNLFVNNNGNGEKNVSFFTYNTFAIDENGNKVDVFVKILQINYIIGTFYLDLDNIIKNFNGSNDADFYLKSDENNNLIYETNKFKINHPTIWDKLSDYFRKVYSNILIKASDNEVLKKRFNIERKSTYYNDITFNLNKTFVLDTLQIKSQKTESTNSKYIYYYNNKNSTLEALIFLPLS
ncbi:hypothetical protein SHELI_v1c04550 [Spiroplasma helicoides]|uniref:Lipoprotein n=1 Tax=Spiroplasma helicoides TaxID=216938 RepID=A0A1B3SKF1_9MOLU|nr:hypothetical protein [Spiroplasma helicoides]AOG60406.1 hypothetical protein SHELI_v1c04550 [Spiroplasma helicoides]